MDALTGKEEMAAEKTRSIKAVVKVTQMPCPAVSRQGVRSQSHRCPMGTPVSEVKVTQMPCSGSPVREVENCGGTAVLGM